MTTDPLAPPLRASSPETDIATFPNATVVQVIGGDPRRGGALVIDLDRVRLRITDRRIVAANTDVEWEWGTQELVGVIHSAAENWSIFQVPGIEDFGVSVEADDVPRFREALLRLPNLRVEHQAFSSAGAAGAVGAAGTPRAGQASSPLSDEPPSVTLQPPPAPQRPKGAVAPLLAPPGSVPPPTVTPEGDRADALRVVSVTSELVPRPGGGRRGRRGAVASRAELAPAHTSLAGIDARNVSAWFGSRLVLDRVSLHMQPGKVTALIGPSGCGKSTFLRILNRMHEMIPGAQMAGQVLVDGHDVYDPERKLTDARREVGMVFQKPNPFPAMSIYDNVLASFRLTGVKATQSLKDEIVESCLSKAGLWKEVKDRLRQPGGGLSGGQQQRLCIARALALTPRVLLMDEPCSALDPTSTRRIEETITEIVSEVTIVIVTHNMQQAARVSDHCAFFLAEHGTPGVIVEHGPTKVMFDSPQDPRTFDYVNGRFG